MTGFITPMIVNRTRLLKSAHISTLKHDIEFLSLRGIKYPMTIPEG